ncbi:MAG: 16S rRNA (guanine(527)-N(7))-methyltransferase RsmG [Bryobacteraceae bacterium]
MSFEEALAAVLPAQLPHRSTVVSQAAQHLALIVEVNQYLNLTRITSPAEAAIKHVLDSVLPWRLFTDAKHILDAGTGAGFPGIPLALVFPEIQFTLSESTQKKARFVQSAVEALGLKNVIVSSQRAEEIRGTDVITARAVAPLSRAIALFLPALKTGARILLYKGPDVETEIAEASAEARKHQITIRIAEKYDLPNSLGTRTIVELIRKKA